MRAGGAKEDMLVIELLVQGRKHCGWLLVTIMQARRKRLIFLSKGIVLSSCTRVRNIVNFEFALERTANLY